MIASVARPSIQARGRFNGLARPVNELRPNSHRLAYVIFIFLNLTLFIRPDEIVPELEALPSYELLIIACFACALPAVTQQLKWQSLRESPITLCMLGLMLAMALSHLFSPHHLFFVWGARMSAYKFFKIVVYYLLLVGLIDSTARLRNFLTILGLFIVALTTVTLLQWHEVVTLPNIDVAHKQIDRDVNQDIVGLTPRLQSTGMFNDPNDFCLVLVTGMVLSLYAMGGRGGLVAILSWLPALIGFGYALLLTRSRGGFMAMIGAMMALFYTRFGFWRSVMLSVVVLPVVFVLFSGRSTEISSASGTGQDRLKLWAVAFTIFREAPLFGIGDGEFTEVTDDHKVAHNSFVQNYAELGFFGGTIFVAAFVYALWSIYRLGAPGIYILDPELRRIRPYMFTLIAGYAAGLMSLSRTTVVPTYIPLALAAAYMRITVTYPPLPPLLFNWRTAKRMIWISFFFLVALYLFVRTNVRWG
jgi:O-antigen ligase